MSSRPPDPPDESTRLKRALLALQKLQSTIDALQSERHQPIAIIGLGCRFPGANTPEEYWRLLSEGRDAISEVPPNRWDVRQYYDPDTRAPGKIATPFGGFIDDVDLFDAHFFGIAPREAASLDPQQRLLLEVSWEALEQAGIAPDSLAGSAAGVFVGISSNDFAQIVMSCDPAEIDHYMGSGNARSVAAGRLSYVLGLKGPSLSIDTACSSSLVAVHLACESLQRQECHLALAGGVNLLFAPEVSISHSRAQMLAPDGRCKAFDASADGFIRAEGCGVVVLKRLVSAIADRDNVLAVILGSAVNHDGRTSALTVPSGPSQEAVIRTALGNAGIDGSSVSYLEAHGTGTRLGDPIEVGALAAALCQGREAANPLIIGSVKTNIGHLEAGAGIAGLIKTVLACLHREIPAHLHVRELNPLIPWDQLPLRVATTSMPWQTRGERRIAGISSFGFSGTNAHVVVAEAPAPAGQASLAAVPVSQSLLVLSAKTEPALRRLVGRYVEHLSATSIDAADVAYSAAIGRAHFAHRLAVTAPATESCREQLDAFLGGRPGPGVSSGHVLIGDRPRVAFLFSGQGSQYPGMGSDLYREHAVFRASVDRCESILNTWIDRPLTDLLFRVPADVLNCTKYTQPALFALEYALAELWRSWGVEPEALLGHSVGEYVAACIAGVFSLEDGLMLIARRAELMQSVTAAGGMVAVLTDEAQVASLVSSYPTEVSVAAINGPRNVVISGARDRVRQLVQDLTAAGVTTVPLAVSHAFHSPHMDAVLAEFGEVASRVRYAAASIDIVSNVTGEIASEEMASPDYWCHHLRQTVRFAAGVRTLERLGCNTCIEIGPKPVLTDLARQSFAPGTGTWLASLKYGQPDNQQMLRSLGTMFTRGATIDWTRFYGVQRRNRVTLPLYPFERQRFWVAPATSRRVDSASAHQSKDASHPLLGCRRWVAGSDEVRYEARLAPDAPLYLGDHHVFDTPSLPASAYLEMALAAGVTWFDTHALTLHNVTFVRALRLDEAKLVQLVLLPHSDGRMIFHIYSRSEANVDAHTTLHASGEIGPATDDGAGRAAALTRDRGEPGEPVPLEWFNLEFNRRGVRFGPAFRALTQIWRGRDHVLASVEAPAAVAEELARYHFHPALLDACCRTSAVFTFAQTEELLLQVGIERLHYYRRPGSRLWASSRLRAAGSPGREEWLADCEVFDETGNCCLAIEGQSARRAARELLDRDVEQRAAQHYELQWVLKPCTATSPNAVESGGWLILADRGGVGARVADLLMEAGASCHLLHHETTDLPSAPWDPEIHRRQTERLRAAIREFATTHVPLRGIVYLWSLEATCARELSIDALQHATMEDAATLLMLLRAITDEALQDVVHSARIWLVTRDAQAAGSAPKLTGIASAPAWGIGKVIALEHPERLGGMIDLSADATSSDPATIVHQLVHGDGEDLVAFRGSERLVARLAPRRYRSGRPLSIRADATYLVTGGLGALGLEIVSWLSDHGARRVCVVGRNGAHSDAARAAVRRLRNAEVEIEVVQADIGDPAQVRRLFAAMDGRPPIRGIVHAAGVRASGPLSQLDPAALRSAFAAKISGTWLLHQLTQDAALDFFVLCSSMVAVWGGKGHADYVAANSFLDASAHYRRARGLPALSIDWGPLEGGGMLPADSIRELSRIGVSTRPMTEAGGVVGDLLGSDAVQVVVADIDWALFRRAYEVRGRRPLFDTVGDESGRESVGPRPAMVVSLLDAAPPNEREQMLRDLVQRTLAEVLGLAAAQISDPRMGFFNLGMDSLTALEFRDRLQASLGVSLPSTLALDYSTVESVAAYLLAARSRPAPPAPDAVVVDHERGHEPALDAVRRLQQLSEEEVEAMLVKKLDAL